MSSLGSCLDGLDVGLDGGISGGELKASLCEFSLKLPSISIVPKLKLPKIELMLPNLIPKFAFKLSCDLNNPIDISAGLSFGGGRIGCVPPNPDDEVF